MNINAVFRTPFPAQVDFFRAKLNLPTARWDDLWQSAHDRGFVVAGAMKADLLADLRGAVDKVIAEGVGIEEFRKDFFKIVAQHGWTDYTGADTAAGRAWRTRVIYQTNLQTSYAAGRWQQLTDPDLLRVRPYWRYIHNDSVAQPRPLHKQWGDLGLTLRHDHPFWQTHFPPNGWGCFPAETAVRCDALLGQRFDYSGKIVELETRLGHRLRVTPNHPVLTRRGWIAAGSLQAGDEVIAASGDVDAGLSGIVDNPQPPTRADNLFETLTAQGLRVIPVAADDFHGDAAGRKGEVHVAGSDDCLMDVIKSASGEFVGEGRLHAALHGGIEAAGISGGPPRAARCVENAVFAQDAADRGFGEIETPSDFGLADQAATVKRHDLAFSFGVAGISGLPGLAKQQPNLAARLDADPSSLSAGAAVAYRDAAQAQDAPEAVAAEPGLYRQLLEANSGGVSGDEVIFIRQFDWSGHVYDFTTVTGLIVAGGIIVSNCRCRVRAVRGPQEGDATAPPEGWDALDPKTGAPQGIDKGFAYAPGAHATTPLREMLDKKLLNLDAPIGAAMWQSLRPAMLAEQSKAFAEFVDAAIAGPARGHMTVVGALDPKWVAAAVKQNIAPATADITVRDEDVRHTFRPGKAHQLDLDWYKQLPRHLATADAVILDTTHETEPAFLLIYQASIGADKLVVRINYRIRKAGLGNIVQTGKLVDLDPVRGMIGHGYELVDGSL